MGEIVLASFSNRALSAATNESYPSSTDSLSINLSTFPSSIPRYSTTVPDLIKVSSLMILSHGWLRP